jgi:hypothetical protein
MPIKGISDIRRFSRGGKIRLGEKRKAKSGAEYPQKLDYFLFDPDDPTVMPELKKLYGDKPRSLRVAFPAEDVDVVYPQWYKLYTASGLRCKGDGVTATRVLDNGAMSDCECPGPDSCPFAIEKGLKGKPGCKRLATLNFFLVDWNQMYVWQINTTGFHSIVNINSQMDILRSVAGRISFIEVSLVLKPVTVQPDGKKQIAYALDLVIPTSLRELKALRPLIAGSPAQAALPAPDESEAPDDLYPAVQIGYENVAVDVDGVVHEFDDSPEPNEAAGSPPYDDEPGDAWEEPQPQPVPESDTVDYENLPEMVELMAKRPAIARAILGQAKGENWTLEQTIQIVRGRLEK